MTLGQKIKKARKSKKMTQAAICSGRITRNMLSAIECDKASPSLDTLKFLALALELPLSYLLSDDENLFFYKKAEKIKDIRALFADGKYKNCIDTILSLSATDDELSYLLTVCYFRLGRASTLKGSLKTAVKFFELSKKYSSLTVYDTEREQTISELYIAVAKNIKAPMLELDQKQYDEKIRQLCDMDFYKFTLQDKEYNYINEIFKKHLIAKELIKGMRFKEALELMKEIENMRTKKNYNAFLVMSLYGDMENCYKHLGDFENAYKYATKQLTLTEEFKT